jgi:hypothetical protein
VGQPRSGSEADRAENGDGEPNGVRAGQSAQLGSEAAGAAAVTYMLAVSNFGGPDAS